MLEAGVKGEQSVEVVYENTATAVGSGVLEVFGTPCMLALMEKTASESVAPYLEEGCGSVGKYQPCSGYSNRNDCSLRDRAYRSRRTSSCIQSSSL